MRVELQSLVLVYFGWYISRLVAPGALVDPQWNFALQGADTLLLNLAFFNLNSHLRNPTLRYWFTNAQVLNTAIQLLSFGSQWAWGSSTQPQLVGVLQQLKPVTQAITGLSILLHTYYISFALLDYLNRSVFRRGGLSAPLGGTAGNKLL